MRDLAGSHIASASSFMNDILVIRDKKVVWYTECGKEVRQFSCETKPLDAIFCHFSQSGDGGSTPNDTVDNAGGAGNDGGTNRNVTVAILITQSYLRLHQSHGEHFDIRLDFEVESICQCSHGILLQSSGKSEETDLSSRHSFVRNHASTQPTLYILRNVTALVQPILFDAEAFAESPSTILDKSLSVNSPSYNNSLSMDSRSRYRFTSNVHEKVVAVYEDLVVTIDRRSSNSNGENEKGKQPLKTLKLWQLEVPVNEEDEEVQAKNRLLPPRAFSSHSNGMYPNSSAMRGYSRHSRSPSPQQYSPAASPIPMSTRMGSPVETLESVLGVGSSGREHIRERDSFGFHTHNTSKHSRHSRSSSPLHIPKAHHSTYGGYHPRTSDASGLSGASPSFEQSRDASMSGDMLRSIIDEDIQELSLASSFNLRLLDNVKIPISAMSGHESGATVDEAGVHVPSAHAAYNRRDFEISFASHPRLIGGLELHFLHRPSGIHRCFRVRLNFEWGKMPTASLENLSDSEQSQNIVTSLAHIQVPLGIPTRISGQAVVPFTITIHDDNAASVYLGEVRIGQTQLVWKDDLDIDMYLCPDDDNKVSGNESKVTMIKSAGKNTSSFIAKLNDKHSHLVNLTPILLSKQLQTGTVDMLLIISAVLQSRGVAAEAYEGLISRVIAILVCSEGVFGAGAGASILLAALFNKAPQIAPYLSRLYVEASFVESLDTFTRSNLEECVTYYEYVMQAVSSASLLPPIFDALHSLWQNMLLATACPRESALINVGAALSHCLEGVSPVANMYVEYYWTSLGQFVNNEGLWPMPTPYAGEDQGVHFTNYDKQVPSVVQWLSKCMDAIHRVSCNEDNVSLEIQASHEVFHELYIPPLVRGFHKKEAMQPCHTLVLLRSFLENLFLRIAGGIGNDNDGRDDSSTRDGTTWARLIADAYISAVPRQGHDAISTLNSLPPLVKAVVDLSLYRCQAHPNQTWPDVVLQHIGRTDLCMKAEHRQMSPTNSTTKPTTSGWSGREGPSGGKSKQQQEISDGLKEVEAAATLRFADDDRVHEVCRMLRSSQSIYLRVEKAPEVSDLDHRHKLQLRLLTLCRRSLACSIGRGMLTLGSLEPLVAEALPVPVLNLSGRIPPNDSIVHLDTSNASPELTYWPAFHNGVAAALRVGLRTELSSRKENKEKVSKQHEHGNNGDGSNNNGDSMDGQVHDRNITRNWIIYNRTAANAIASNASNSHGPGDMAMPGHAGVILGLGLQGHLQVLSMGDICDYLTQGHEPTTIATLLGISASKLGSADSRISKTLCLHLPSLLPSRHWDIDISPLVQTAALAGLGLLHAGSGHRLITEFLLAELSRRPTSDRCDCRDTMALSTAWALGLVLLGKGSSQAIFGKEGGTSRNRSSGMEGLVDLRIEDRLCELFSGGRKPAESSLFPTATNSVNDVNSKANRILEGDEINVDVLGPGATIALALIYIKSNNKEIAKRLAVPTTIHALDSMRSDLLLYRAMGICLVLWDSVESSEAWIDAQIPSVVSKVLFEEDDGEEEHPTFASTFRRARKLEVKDAVCVYICLIAGYCYGMGLVYAGTGDEQVKHAIHAKLKLLQSIRDNKMKFRTNRTVMLDTTIRPLVDTCVSTVACSLSIVMAGSGDVMCLRTFRELRWKVDDVTFGTHMALSMAIGMLFLSGGNASLKRDPLSIACLLLSICPRFPARTVDNQYHLQAFRHLYVLALQTRVLKTVDVDTGTAISVDVDMDMRNGEVLTMRAPCLLPELDSIKAVRINRDKENDIRSSNGQSVADNSDDNNNKDLDKTVVMSSATDIGDIHSDEDGEEDDVTNEYDSHELNLLIHRDHHTLQNDTGSLYPRFISLDDVNADSLQNLKVKRKNTFPERSYDEPDKVCLASSYIKDTLHSFADASKAVDPVAHVDLGASVQQELVFRMLQASTNSSDKQDGVNQPITKSIDDRLSESLQNCLPVVALLNGVGAE